jgi:hypothetical protein
MTSLIEYTSYEFFYNLLYLSLATAALYCSGKSKLVEVLGSCSYEMIFMYTIYERYYE